MLKDIIDTLSPVKADSILNEINENLKSVEEKHLIESLEKLFTLAGYSIALGKLIRIKQMRNQDKVNRLEIEAYSEYKTFYSLCASYIDCFTDFYILFKEHSSINNLDNSIKNSPLISLAKRELEAHYVNLYYLDENKHDCQQMWEYLVYMDKSTIAFLMPEEIEKLKKSFYLKYVANKENRKKIESGKKPFPKNFRLDRWTKKEQSVLVSEGVQKTKDSAYSLLTAFKDLYSIQGHGETLKTSMTFYPKKMNLLKEGLIFCQYLGLFIDVVFYFQEITSYSLCKNERASFLKDFEEQKDYLLMFVRHLTINKLDNEDIDNSKEFRDAEVYITNIIPEAKLVDPPAPNRGEDYPHRNDIIKALQYRFMYNWISKGSSEVFGMPVQWSDFEGELFRIEADRILKRLGGSIPEENLKCRVVSDKEEFYRQRFYIKISQI